MNKSDIKLIITVFMIILFMFSLFIFTKEEDNKVAQVYYKNKLIKEIDMSQDINEEYEVIATMGIVVIEYDNGKIRVKEETSNRNLCSKQGFIDESYETIVCLPNELIVLIKAKDNLDTIIK